MVIKIFILTAILIMLFVILVQVQAEDFVVERAIEIAAPPEKIFPYLNDLHLWNDWSPWARLDPNMKQTFDGPSSGEGASYSWIGNKKVGEGKMTILQSVPSELLKLSLEFLAPFKASNIAEFSLHSKANQTFVIWRMTGKRNFMMKAFGMVMNMDTLIGRDFSKGLASLKQLAEVA